MMYIKHHLDVTPTEPFWNRHSELKAIRRLLQKRCFGYVTGRRRVGKTALLVKACEIHKGFYHQAVEGTSEQQLLHLAAEMSLKFRIFKDITPKSWNEFFRLLHQEKLPKKPCLSPQKVTVSARKRGGSASQSGGTLKGDTQTLLRN